MLALMGLKRLSAMLFTAWFNDRLLKKRPVGRMAGLLQNCPGGCVSSRPRNNRALLQPLPHGRTCEGDNAGYVRCHVHCGAVVCAIDPWDTCSQGGFPRAD